MLAWIFHIRLSIGLLQDQVLQLGDLKEPEPIPFSFNTLGWKIVFVLLLGFVFFILYKWHVAYKKKQYIRDAVKHIQGLSQETDLTVAQFINDILFTLKRTAMCTFGRTQVAGLHGKDWLQFLDETVKQSDFSADEHIILQAVYKETVADASAFNKEEFKNKSIHWITHHA